MCIVCDNSEIGSSFLENWGVAIQALKSCEKSLLLLSDEKNVGTIDSKKQTATDYNRAHKRLVKIRKQLVEIERLRTGQVQNNNTVAKAKTVITFKQFQQVSNEFSNKINKVKEFPETDTFFDRSNYPPINPFISESTAKSMVEFSKAIEATAKHLKSLSKNSKPETDLEKKMREAKESILQSNLSFEIVTTEMQLSKYLCKNLINRIKEKQPDKFKCLIALKAELKFLVDRYGKI